MPKPKFKPDDRCPCGGGKLYGNCHGPIYDAPRGKMIEVAHRIYAKAWAVNAAHYQGQGLYTQLAEELAGVAPIHRVLDLGCGHGQGVEALAAVASAPDKLVLGIDENPDCLASAQIRLNLPETAVDSTRIANRLAVTDRYEAVPDRAAIAVEGDICLVATELFTPDPAFEGWLRSVGPFDAITLWFTGGHKARQETKVAHQIGARGDADFREAIEDAAMELAVRHLKPGGLAQIVTRAVGDPETKRRELELRRAIAIADWPFDLVHVRAYPYDESGADNGMILRSEFGGAGETQHVALSTIVRGWMRSTEDVMKGHFALAHRTPFNIAPERAAALAREVFGSGDWTLNDSGGKATFSAYVPEKALYASYAGLASLWALAHVAWAVIDFGSRASRDAGVKGQTAVDFGQAWAEQNLSAYIAYARNLIHRDAPWPLALDLPDAKAPFNSPAGRTNNLFFGALSWILLHEVGHIHHDHEEVVPASRRITQEEQADDFATAWALEEAGAGLKRECRVLMIVTALAWLFMFEQEGGRSQVHPPVILRFRTAAQQFDLGDRSAALENAAYLLKALFDPTGAVPTRRPTSREAFDWISGRLADIFPQS